MQIYIEDWKGTLSTLHYAVEAVGIQRVRRNIVHNRKWFQQFCQNGYCDHHGFKQALGSPLHTISFKPSSLCGQVFAMSSPKLMAVKSDTFFFVRLT